MAKAASAAMSARAAAPRIRQLERAAARPAAPGTRIVEEAGARGARRRASAGKGGRKLEFVELDGRDGRRGRRGARPASPSSTASAAAGWCRGSAILIGGDPGIGKSTLLLQVGGAVARRREAAGRSPTSPARRRSTRCGCARARLGLARRRRAARRRDQRARHPRQRSTARDAPDVVVIDSIQTMYLDTLDSAPGTVARCAPRAARADPRRQAARLRPGAGRPRHQGRPDRRPARARAHGRHRALFRGRARPPVPHPARGQEPLRPDRRDRRVRDDRRRPGRGRQPVGAVPGRARAATSAARRSSPASRARGRCWSRSRPWSRPRRSATPRRAVVGWDGARLAMMLAVLEARCGLAFAGNDVYLNVAGGLADRASRRPTSRWRRRWSRALTGPPVPRESGQSSARSACAARCARSASAKRA